MLHLRQSYIFWLIILLFKYIEKYTLQVHSRSGAGKHHFIKNNAEPKFQLGKGYVSKGKAFTEADDMRETNDYSPHYNELVRK